METNKLSSHFQHIRGFLGKTVLTGVEAVDNAMDVWGEEDVFLPGVEMYPVSEAHLVRGEE